MNTSTALFNRKHIVASSVCLLLVIFVTQYRDEAYIPFEINSQAENDSNNSLIHAEKNEEVILSSENILDLKMFRFSSVDGDIRVDDDGHLIIDRDLRHWIDFHLSAIGELSLIEIKHLMKQQILLLPMPGREQATNLLANYLGYKEALASYEDQFKQLVGNDHLENLQQRHDWQKRLRREALSNEAVEAFWQLDELVDDYALEQLVINGSNSTEEEKRSQLERLETALPEELKQFRRDLYVASNLQETIAASREQGESNEVIRQQRIEQVGIEATDRLEALEIKQNLWQQRIVAYANEMKAVSAIEGISAQDKQDQIKQYQDNHFDEKEQLRLETALHLLVKE